MSEQVESLVVSFIVNDSVNDEMANETSVKLANLILDNENIKLLNIIMALKDPMTSEDDSLRKKSLNCLSSVLNNLTASENSQVITKNEISVIFNFYFNKLNDTVLIKEAFDGFLSILQFNNNLISGLEIISLLNYLKNDYIPTNYLAAIRFLPFKIIESIYSQKFKQDTNLIINSKITNLFIETYINIASGEKDPRNLLLSFDLNKLITTTLHTNTHPIISFAQQLFDILFSYFPITFKPPKNDPYKIGNADLKLSLRSALSATDLFANDAFANLIEKLSASSPSVKNDTLLTLIACIQNFKGDSCQENSIDLWKALKFEIMHSIDDTDDSNTARTPTQDWTTPSSVKQNEEDFLKNNYQAALMVITSLSGKLVQYDELKFVAFADYIIEELKPNFQHSKDLKQSCAILSAIGSANEIAFNKIIEDSLPLFLINSTEIPKLKLLLMNLSFFLNSYMNVFGQTNDAKDDTVVVPQNKLADYKDEILMILGMALTGNSKIEVAVRTLAVIQFTKLIKMKAYLTREEIALIVQYLTETILTDNNKHIYCVCLEGLKVISEFYEDIVYDVSLKQMLELLPSSFNNLPKFHNDEYVEIETILKVILDFTNSRHSLIKESIISLTSKLLEVTKENAERSIDYCFLVLSTIYSLFENNIALMSVKESISIKESIESTLFNIISLTGDKNIIQDDFNFSILANIFYFINLKNNGIASYSNQLQHYIDIFIENNCNETYQILSENFPSRLILPFTKILSALDKDIEFSKAKEYFTRVINLLQHNKCESELEKLGYYEFLMVLTNKWIDDDFVKENINFNKKTNVNLEIITWIGKGLVMKNSSLAPMVLTNFINLLSDKEVGTLVSKLFEIFVIDINSMKKYKGISWNNNVKPLYKQKFFSDIFKVLLTSYKETSTMYIKCNYLTALSLVLKHTPSRLVEPFMDDLLPMLLEALEMPNSEVRTSSLETLTDVTEKFNQLMTDHVHTLIPLLLTLVIPDHHNSVLVRLLSLKLLELITTVVPLNYCLEFKEKILVGLVVPLSDKKRAVRKQCIDTRQAYFELGQAPFE